MTGYIIIAVAAGLLLLARRSPTLSIPEGGTPNGTIPSTSGLRRAPPAGPSDDWTEAQRREYIDKYNAWANAEGKPPVTYDQIFGTSTDSEAWYYEHVGTSGGLIAQVETEMTNFGSAIYNWAQGVGETVTRR